MQPQRDHVRAILALSLAWAFAAAVQAETLTLHTRSRVPAAGDTNEWRAVEQTAAWDAQHSALVICDMWDKHWCPADLWQHSRNRPG